MSTNLHFSSYIDNRDLLFPPHLDQNIDDNDPVRLIDSIIDSLDITGSPNNGLFFIFFQKLSLQNGIFRKISQKSAA